MLPVLKLALKAKNNTKNRTRVDTLTFRQNIIQYKVVKCSAYVWITCADSDFSMCMGCACHHDNC